MAITYADKKQPMESLGPFVSLDHAARYQKQNADLFPHQVDDSADASKGNLGMAVIPNFDSRPLTDGVPFKNLRGGK